MPPVTPGVRKKMNNSNNEKKDILYYGGHIVAFADILGQSDILDSFKTTEWWQIDESVKVLLQQSYGRVLKLRKIFEGFLKSFCQPIGLDCVFQELVDPDRESSWDHFGEKRILSKSLSDSLILTFPLQIEHGHIPIKSVFGVFSACAIGFMSALNYGFSIRGAIEFGPCIYDPRSKEVYGTALNDAVKLEKKADWPRFVIGPELVKYLSDCSRIKSNQMMHKINAGSATLCLSVISEDEHGVHYLDFFKSGFKDLHQNSETKLIVDGALKFAEKQISIYEKEEKVRRKYEKLKWYLSRSDLY